MNKVVVVSLNNKHRSYEKEIKKIAKRVLQFFKKGNCYLEIFLVTSRKMKFLNKKFRNKDKTADILTFIEPKKFPHPESKLKHLGEIYLNAEVSSFKLQAPILLVHGLLHLFGFSHKKKSDGIKMEIREKFLISNV